MDATRVISFVGENGRLQTVTMQTDPSPVNPMPTVSLGPSPFPIQNLLIWHLTGPLWPSGRWAPYANGEQRDKWEAAPDIQNYRLRDVFSVDNRYQTGVDWAFCGGRRCRPAPVPW